jgi:hypothetical protein
VRKPRLWPICSAASSDRAGMTNAYFSSISSCRSINRSRPWRTPMAWLTKSRTWSTRRRAAHDRICGAPGPVVRPRVLRRTAGTPRGGRGIADRGVTVRPSDSAPYAAPLALAVPASAGTSAMPTSSAVPTPAPYPGAFVAASALTVVRKPVTARPTARFPRRPACAARSSPGSPSLHPHLMLLLLPAEPPVRSRKPSRLGRSPRSRLVPVDTRPGPQQRIHDPPRLPQGLRAGEGALFAVQHVVQ